jgi:hypothetical protein
MRWTRESLVTELDIVAHLGAHNVKTKSQQAKNQRCGLLRYGLQFGATHQLRTAHSPQRDANESR